MDAMEKKSVGDNQYNGSQNFPTHSEAAKQAGFGNEKTARQATKVVHEGAPELVELTTKCCIENDQGFQGKLLYKVIYWYNLKLEPLMYTRRSGG